MVAPGFINMMSWAAESLIEDGRSLSDVLQGVTLEVMGEGSSMGPLNASMRETLEAEGISGAVTGFRYPVEWSTLSGYLRWLEASGISPNVASFVGAGTLRVHEVGHADRPATDPELQRMCALLDAEMREGALGVASALIYPPETAYRTDELVALARVAATRGGMYASHVRGEGAGLVRAIGELIDIARRAQVPAEVYHLKAAGQEHWDKLSTVLDMIEVARAEGLAVTADVYPYDYSGTSLSTCIPPWAHEGGVDALRRRLSNQSEREQIGEEMRRRGWENPLLDAGPDHIRVLGPLVRELAEYTGRTIADIARRRNTSPQEAVMDLVRENPGDVFALYFDINPQHVRTIASLPWVSFCSDAESLSTQLAAQRGGIHPRAFGAFARVLGRFVREEGLIPLAQAIRQMTSLPADNLGLRDRGRLRQSCYADIVVFDADTICDHARPEDPYQYATGMVHVLINGTHVLHDRHHTGALPGRFVRGPARIRTPPGT